MATRANIYRVGLALLVGAIGVGLSRVVDIPGGAFTSALVLTAVACLAGLPLTTPPNVLRSAGRILLGLTVGASVTSETLVIVANALLPVAVTIMAMIGFSLLVSRVITRLTSMSRATALCGSAPGALAAMVALAEDLGGDAPVVASMHLVRLISVLLFTPAFVTTTFHPAHEAAQLLTATTEVPEHLALRLLLMLAIGFIAGFLANRAKIPAGDLLAGMVVAAVANPLLLQVRVPASWRIIAQWLVATGVGTGVTREALRGFRPYALAGVLMTLAFIVGGLGLGRVLSALTPIDLVTAIIGTSPGGADTMIILAGELGADTHLVTAMHVMRQVIILMVVPVLARSTGAGKRTVPLEESAERSR